MSSKPDLAARAQRIEGLRYDYASRPKRRITHCNLCGHDVLVTITQVDRYGYNAKATACEKCGLTVLNPVMTNDAYTEFYINVYRPLVSAYHGRLIDAHAIQDEQVKYAAALGDFLAPALEGRGFKSLLDVGGSTGVVAHHLGKRFGLQGVVIDPAPMEIEVAQKFGLQTVTGFVEDYQPDSQFDMVMICQTVDHLLDVSSALTKIRDLIRPDGVFFVDIVDFRAAYLRNHSTEGAVKIDHPYYLTQATMRAYLARAGFAVRAVNYAQDHLHIGFLCTPTTPQPEMLPDPDDTRRYFEEIRWIQNAKPPTA